MKRVALALLALVVLTAPAFANGISFSGFRSRAVFRGPFVPHVGVSFGLGGYSSYGASFAPAFSYSYAAPAVFAPTPILAAPFYVAPVYAAPAFVPQTFAAPAAAVQAAPCPQQSYAPQAFAAPAYVPAPVTFAAPMAAYAPYASFATASYASSFALGGYGFSAAVNRGVFLNRGFVQARAIRAPVFGGGRTVIRTRVTIRGR